MAVSKRLRYEVLRRDDYACRYCGSKAPDVQLTVDHVIPVTLGGSDEAGNLVTACANCNAGKSSTGPGQPVVEQVSRDAIRWAAAMREAAAIQATSRDAVQRYRDRFLERWDAWTYGPDEERLPLPDDWHDTLVHFQQAGLEIDRVLDLVDVAGRSRASARATFRYFCGCCWRELRDRQEIAQDLLANEKED